MKAVGNLARLIEERAAHAQTIYAALNTEPPETCPECGQVITRGEA